MKEVDRSCQLRLHERTSDCVASKHGNIEALHNRLLLMLKAYLDDSSMGQAPVYVLAGWVASAKVWAPFADAWDKVLRMSPRIEYFKFDDAMTFDGPFRGMSEESEPRNYDY